MKHKGYGAEFTQTLALIWERYEQPCGKLLVPLIQSAIDFLAESTPRSGH